MATYTTAFSGFSSSDTERSRAFYEDVLGLDVGVDPSMGGMLTLNLPGGSKVLVYPVEHHVPGSYTVLNLAVDDVGAVVDELTARGVVFERYDGLPQDDKGVMRGNGPTIAWFKDPDGNVLSVIEGEGP